MSNFVFILNTDKTPIQPCHPSVARKLLKEKKAAVFRRYPFTLILKNHKENVVTQPTILKIDPGSRVTGLALVSNDKVIWGGELHHRGQQIKESLLTRRTARRSRRNRHTRYRKPRFLNRTKPKGWLPPSLKHRVLTTMTWVKRLYTYAPINTISQELVRFDPQKLDNPNISGIEYTQGTLQGYEVKEYLLEKWQRKCAYCNKENTVFEVEHIIPKSKGGSSRISNLTLACRDCNQKKGNLSIEDFLKGKPELLKTIKDQIKTPLKDAEAVNATRWSLYNALKTTGLPVLISSGGKTKCNRVRLGLSKTHWLDAACVGETPNLEVLIKKHLKIEAKGQGTRRLCRLNKYGFPITKPRCTYNIGWNTGDLAMTVKNAVTYTGKIVIQSATRLEIRTNGKRISGHLLKFHRIHKKDGYLYS